jgi:hypothetical protein
LGLGWARFFAFWLGLFRALKFKIGLKGVKSWAFITGLKICQNLLNFTTKDKQYYFWPVGPDRLYFPGLLGFAQFSGPQGCQMFVIKPKIQIWVKFGGP